jgi:hypothetical protein
MQAWHKEGQGLAVVERRPMKNIVQLTCSPALISAFMLAALAFAGNSNARQPPAARDTQVTLVIYSGRVDPVWTLTRAEAVEFRDRLKHLPKAASIAKPPDMLGFLNVSMPDKGWPRQSVTLDHGSVIWKDRKVLHSLVDNDRKLETWLLATGKGRTSENARWFTIQGLDRHP